MEHLVNHLSDDGFIFILLPAVQAHVKEFHFCLNRCAAHVGHEWKLNGRDAFINPNTGKRDKNGAKQPSSIFLIRKGNLRGWRTEVIDATVFSQPSLFPLDSYI